MRRERFAKLGSVCVVNPELITLRLGQRLELGLGYKIWGLEFGDSGFGIRVKDLGLGVLGGGGDLIVHRSSPSLVNFIAG